MSIPTEVTKEAEIILFPTYMTKEQIINEVDNVDKTSCKKRILEVRKHLKDHFGLFSDSQELLDLTKKFVERTGFSAEWVKG